MDQQKQHALQKRALPAGSPSLKIVRHRHFVRSRIKQGQYVGNAEFVDAASGQCWSDGFTWHYMERFDIAPSPSFYWFVMRFDLGRLEDSLRWVIDCPLLHNSTTVGPNHGTGCSTTNGPSNGAFAVNCSSPSGIEHALKSGCIEGTTILAGSECITWCVQGYQPAPTLLLCLDDGTLAPATFTC